jgi:hypothetical protein
MTMAYIQNKGDGTGKTMMVTESLATLYWSYRSQDDDDYTKARDASHHFGFTWELPTAVANDTKRRINGSRDPVNYNSFQAMTQSLQNESATLSNPPDTNQRPGMPSSNHPTGINVVYVDSHADFLAEDIEPFVYAQLMTSNHKESDLPGDKTSPEPDDSQF